MSDNGSLFEGLGLAEKRALRIAHVTSELGYEGAGVCSVVEALSANQAELGREVRVFGLESAGWLKGEHEDWAGAPASAFAVAGPKALGYAPGLITELAAFRPKVIHLHGLWTYSSLASLWVSRRLSAARVVSPHGMLDTWALAQSKLKKRAALALLERANLNGATIHALNASEAEAIRSLGLSAPIATIPNGVTPPPHEAGVGVAMPWAGLLPDGARVMLFLGRVHPKKGLREFILALTHVRQQLAKGNWHLIIAGWDQDGHRTELEELIDVECLGARVHFVGPVFGAEKAAALENAELFVLPSHSEGLPMSVLEAWSYNLPVLFTPQCNLPDGEEAGAAWLSEPEPTALSEKLEEILVLPYCSLAKVGKRGALLVSKRFTWEIVEAQFTRLYSWQAGRIERPEFVALDQVEMVSGGEHALRQI